MPDPTTERALIGATLNHPNDLALRTPAADFYDPRHEIIWTHIQTLHTAGEPIDAITVAASLTAAGQLVPAGGLPYLHELVSEGLNSAAAPSYARIVSEQAAFRRLNVAATRTLQMAESGEGNARDIAALAVAEIEAATPTDTEARPTLLKEHLYDVIDDLDSDEPLTGIEWPYADARRVLLPMQPGNLVVVGARPGVGKSVTLVDLARHHAIRHRRTVVLHSLEMSARELVKRIIAAEARVPMDRVQSKTLNPDDWTRITEATERLAEANLHIYDSPDARLSDLRASIKAHKPDLLILDYVQIATVPKADNRTLAIGEFSRGLKVIAKTAGIPVVTASQLKRPEHNAADKPPVLSDLRESGSLEQDADTVVLLHRPDAVDNESTRAGEIDFIIAKQRNGGTGTVTLGHQMHYSRIVDMAA